jgi:hypothetical protein
MGLAERKTIWKLRYKRRDRHLSYDYALSTMSLSYSTLIILLQLIASQYLYPAVSYVRAGSEISQ